MLFTLRSTLTKSLGLRHAVRRFSSQKPHFDHPQPPKKAVLKNRFLQGLMFGIGGGLAFSLVGAYLKNQKAINDSPISVLKEVNLQPTTDVKPFPSLISINKVPFQAIATGVRTVTFLNFHVYAVGLYVAVDDLGLMQNVFKKNAAKYGVDGAAPQWEALLGNPITGREIVGELLTANVRLAIRITPSRNTDFNHMRDGFVRSVMNQPEAKKLQSVEFGLSVGEIKRAFSRKRKFQKGEVVVWARDINGGMTTWFGDDDETKEMLGSPQDNDVVRLFFLQYMSGDKPNSPTLKQNAVHTLAALAASED